MAEPVLKVNSGADVSIQKPRRRLALGPLAGDTADKFLADDFPGISYDHLQPVRVVRAD
jgi:hypothetical protein